MDFEPGEAAGYTTGGLFLSPVPPFKWGLRVGEDRAGHASAATWPDLITGLFVGRSCNIFERELARMPDDSETIALRVTVIGGQR
jgi:hypothetical protein